MKELKITEATKDDISTIYAYLTVPEDRGMGTYGPLPRKMCDVWTEFNNHYPRNGERKFIAEIDRMNPGKYIAYHIGYDNCN